MQWLPFALTVVLGTPPSQTDWVTPPPGPQYGAPQQPAKPLGPPAASPLTPAPVPPKQDSKSAPHPIDPPYADPATGGDGGEAPSKPDPTGRLQTNHQDPAQPNPFGPGRVGHGNPTGKLGPALPNGHFGTPQPGGDSADPKPGGKLGSAMPAGNYGVPTPAPQPNPFGPGHVGHGNPTGKLGPALPNGHFGTPQPGGDGDPLPGDTVGGDPNGHVDPPKPMPFDIPDGPREIEQRFTILVTDHTWEEGLTIAQYPGLIKSARMEISVEGRWTLLTESLSAQADPPVTQVLFQGRSTVNSAGRDLMATGNIQHGVQTLFDGLWDWKGASGEFGSATQATDVTVIELSPAKFSGNGVTQMPISGTLTDSYQVLGDTDQTAVKVMAGARVSVRLIFEPK